SVVVRTSATPERWRVTPEGGKRTASLGRGSTPAFASGSSGAIGGRALAGAGRSDRGPIPSGVLGAVLPSANGGALPPCCGGALPGPSGGGNVPPRSLGGSCDFGGPNGLGTATTGRRSDGGAAPGSSSRIDGGWCDGICASA